MKDLGSNRDVQRWGQERLRSRPSAEACFLPVLELQAYFRHCLSALSWTRRAEILQNSVTLKAQETTKFTVGLYHARWPMLAAFAADVPF